MNNDVEESVLLFEKKNYQTSKKKVMENTNTKNLNRLVFSNESHADFSKDISEELIPENPENIRINNVIPSWNAP